VTKLDVDAELRRASAIGKDAYGEDAYRRSLDRVFARTWHVVADAGDVASAEWSHPTTLLPGSLDEPLVLVRDGAHRLRCLSNVCTHRANLLVHEPCRTTSLRCRYHGRRFGLDGRFAHMPEMEGAAQFPSKTDDLPSVAYAEWGPLVFASIAPAHPFDGAAFARIPERAFGPPVRKEYEVRAHWALYVENYLEGFHVPFVHAGLAEVLDYGSYRTEVLERAVLQVGIAKEGELAFAGPERVAGHYLWLYPSTMINAYPWGLSVNLIQPLGVDRTRVVYLTYVSDEAKAGQGAGKDLHRVELEDETVVEAVQRGVRSRLYRPGRLSPAREAGVHAFHRLLAADLAHKD